MGETFTGDAVWRELEEEEKNTSWSRSEIPPTRPILNRLPTFIPALFQGFLVVAHLATTVALKFTNTSFSNKCSNLNVILVFQIAVWCISSFIDHYYHDQHKILMVCGHGSFCKSLKKRSSLIFAILSWWNTLTIAYLVYSVNYTYDMLCDWTCPYSAVNLTVWFVVVNSLAVLSVLYLYISKVLTFNKMNPVSDIDALESWRQEMISSTSNKSGQDVEELLRLLERQSYMLEFYRTMNADMARWVSAKIDSD